MRKFVIFVTIVLATSVFIFGFGLEFGAGVTLLSSYPLPTIAAGINVPVMGGLSATGQFNTLFLAGSGTTVTFFMALGGGRYTFNMDAIKVFVGADGGIISNFSGTSSMIPIFGVNGGVMFKTFYLKGAWRMWNLKYPTANISVNIPILELTAGVNWIF